MANPFDLLAQFQAFKDQSSALLESTDSGWFMRAGTTQVLEWVLQKALDAGPPPSFGADLAIDDAQARVLYARVLRAALLRQRELVTNGR